MNNLVIIVIINTQDRDIVLVPELFLKNHESSSNTV